LILEICYLHHHRKGNLQMSTVSLSWENPTTRTDGTSLSPDEIASIDISDDVGDGNGAQIIGSVSGAGTSFTTGTLAVGNHSFTIVINDTTGHKSAPSNAFAVSVPATLAAPSAVTTLTGTLNQS
jgi:hypothetical protein